ncbi:MAG: hypothetical protein KAS73_12155, partial [Candidatus Sabulitectum sp.]|nr:hypothetical protein [Candidatus Sabulitectum sp.]
MSTHIDSPELEIKSLYLQKLWAASTGALVVCDSSRQILQINPSFSLLFQTTTENCISGDLDELITPAPFLPESECVFDTAITGTPVSIKTVKVKSDGTLTGLFQIAVQIITDSG